jgi:hypothetical protein
MAPVHGTELGLMFPLSENRRTGFARRSRRLATSAARHDDHNSGQMDKLHYIV